METSKVFGVSNEKIESYIEREKVDDLFKSGIRSNKHIIVFGSSKQGKTALTNRHVIETECVKIDCSPETNPVDIYKSVLRQLNIEFEVEKNTTNEISGELNSEVTAKVSVPFISGDASLGAVVSGSKTSDVKTVKIEYNLNLPQDISEILRKINFKKRIILENFHYLKEEVQKQLAFDLRVFEDNNILFVILGIWREKNRLAQFNGDLQDRLIEIPVEPWEKEDFKKVVNIGEGLLNVSFNNVLSKIEEVSFDSIGVFQEMCKESCFAAGVLETSKEIITLTEEHFLKAVDKKMDDYRGRHTRSIECFVEQTKKSNDAVPLYLAYYFIKFLFEQNFEIIVGGLKRPDIHAGIKKNHHRPDDVRSSDMSNFLHNIVPSQISKSIVPPIFDYDSNSRTLKIIDSTFYFFLRNSNLNEIFEDFDKPEGIS
jgi:hypothetical protein